MRNLAISALIAASLCTSLAVAQGCPDPENQISFRFVVQANSAHATPGNTTVCLPTDGTVTTVSVFGASLAVSITNLGLAACPGGTCNNPCNQTGTGDRLRIEINPQGLTIGDFWTWNIQPENVICGCSTAGGLIFGNIIGGGCGTNTLTVQSNSFASFDVYVYLCQIDCTLTQGVTAPGSWGTEPEIATWNSYQVPIGTPYFAVLLENVGLPVAMTQPQLLVGTDTSSWLGATLPLDLGGYGAPGFQLLVSPEWILPPTGVGGAHYAELGLAIPNEPVLVGSQLTVQWLLRDPTNNPLGVSLTRAAEIHFMP